MKKKLMVLSGLFLGAVPLVALAQVGIVGSTSTGCNLTPATGTVLGLLCRMGELINAAIPVLIALGVLYFVWGVVTYVIASDEEAKKAGRDRIIYGIIGLAVIIAVWGLVAILRNTFGLSNVQNINFPTTPY